MTDERQSTNVDLKKQNNPFAWGVILGFIVGVIMSTFFSDDASGFVKSVAEAIAIVVPKEHGVFAIALLVVPYVTFKVMDRCLNFVKDIRNVNSKPLD
jgi:di/tricarboxylate transporter